LSFKRRQASAEVQPAASISAAAAPVTARRHDPANERGRLSLLSQAVQIIYVPPLPQVHDQSPVQSTESLRTGTHTPRSSSLGRSGEHAFPESSAKKDQPFSRERDEYLRAQSAKGRERRCEYIAARG